MKEIKTNNAPKAIGPYSQGIVAGDFVFVSGQIAINPETGIFDQDLSIEDQTKQVLNNIGFILKEENLTFSDVVKTEIFITDIKNFKIVNDIYGEYFLNKPMPSRQTVEVSALPLNSKIEISCIAKK